MNTRGHSFYTDLQRDISFETWCQILESNSGFAEYHFFRVVSFAAMKNKNAQHMDFLSSLSWGRISPLCSSCAHAARLLLPFPRVLIAAMSSYMKSRRGTTGESADRIDRGRDRFSHHRGEGRAAGRSADCVDDTLQTAIKTDRSTGRDGRSPGRPDLLYRSRRTATAPGGGSTAMLDTATTGRVQM